MNAEHDLIGKTITGIIASTPTAGSAREIWLMQFSDGTYVEFVSPRAKSALRRTARRPVHDRQQAVKDTPQLALNVA